MCGKNTCRYKTKCMSAVHINRRSMHALCTNYDAHGSRLVISCVHVCISCHRTFVHTQDMFQTFSEMCQVMQLPHECIVKFKWCCILQALLYFTQTFICFRVLKPCVYSDPGIYMSPDKYSIQSAEATVQMYAYNYK